MTKSFWAKVFGWAQFGVATAGQIGQQIQQTGTPHGFWGWLPVALSALTAVGIHHASNSNGTN